MKREADTPQQTKQRIPLGFFDVLDRVGTFVLANLLWVFSSLLVVTIPAATAGLFSVLSPLVRGKEVEPFQAFVEGARRHWLRSTQVAALELAAVALIVANVTIISRMDMSQPLTRISQVMTISLGLAVLMVNFYIWPLLVVFDLKVRQLIEMAVRMAFGHALHSLLWLLAALLPLAISLFSLPLILITISFAGYALVSNWGAWRIIRRYVDKEELARLES